jgi:hypothetical protein
MRSLIWLFCAISAFLLFSNISYAVDYNDGGFHIVDGGFQTIRVDYETPSVGTIVETHDGASGYWIKGYEDSIINIKGGTFTSDSKAYDRCQFNLSGGTLEGLMTHHDSTVYITGGQVNLLYQAIDNTYVNISGGSLVGGIFIQNNSDGMISGGNHGYLTVADYSQTTVRGGTFGGLIQAGSYWDKGYGHHSLIVVEGTNFVINGIPVSYGDSARDYATQVQPWMYSGTLTGTLANGDVLNTTIEIIDEADMIFVIPEPATLSLLLLGGLWARKRRPQRL